MGNLREPFESAAGHLEVRPAQQSSQLGSPLHIEYQAGIRPVPAQVPRLTPHEPPVQALRPPVELPKLSLHEPSSGASPGSGDSLAAKPVPSLKDPSDAKNAEKGDKTTKPEVEPKKKEEEKDGEKHKERKVHEGRVPKYGKEREPFHEPKDSESLRVHEPHKEGENERLHIKDVGKLGNLPDADGSIKEVKDDANGVYYRKTEKDESGNLVIHNYDRDKKLTMKMWTRPDGVRQYDNYESIVPTPDSGKSPSDGNGPVPKDIDEATAKKGQRVESRTLEYPDKHTDFWTYNKDGSSKVISAMTDKYFSQTSEYDKHGRKTLIQTVSW